MKNLLSKNILFIHSLGLLIALFITTTFERAWVISLILIIITFIFTFKVSAFRRFLPKNLILPSILVFLAVLVTIIEYLLSVYLPSLQSSIGVYLPLIAVSTLFIDYELIIDANDKFKSIFKKMMLMILGYSLALVIISLIREILGSGTLTILNETTELFKYRAIYKLYPVNSILPIKFLIEPAGAYILIGLLMAIVKGLFQKRGENNA